MATKTDLDTKLTEVAAQVAQVGTDVKSAIQVLMDKISQGAPPEDLQPEMDQLSAIGDALAGIDKDALASGQPITPTP